MTDNIIMELGGGWAVAQAVPEEACRWAHLYRGQDEHLRDMAELLPLYEDSQSVWLLKDGERVAGAIAQQGAVCRPFAIPPNTGLADAVQKFTDYVRKITPAPEEEGDAVAFASTVRLSELDDFFRAGWVPHTGAGDGLVWCRAMVRPTGNCEYPLPEGYSAEPLTPDGFGEAAKLLHEAYNGADPTREDPDDFLEDLRDRELHTDDACRRASTAIYSAEGMQGACLVALFAGRPMLWDLVVRPSSRGKGLARAMVARALTGLAGEHHILKLFVEAGNPAQRLYHSMGFLALETTCDLILMK